MAINTELPISKVTLDDQELSLASSGGGGRRSDCRKVYQYNSVKK